MESKPRFYEKKTSGGQLLIMDRKDESVCFFVHRGKKKREHVEAMVSVVLEALNGAVSKGGA